MPVIKSAIKKLRQDKKREKENNTFRKTVENAVRAAKKTKTKKAISEAFSLVDKAAKRNLLHPNKAARIKSSLVKAPSTKTPTQTPIAVKKAPKTTKTAPKKPTKK